MWIVYGGFTRYKLTQIVCVLFFFLKPFKFTDTWHTGGLAHRVSAHSIQLRFSAFKVYQSWGVDVFS